MDSQIVVFSKTSLQSNQIRPRNPRVIYFNDSVIVAWVRGGFIEIAAHDPAQGAVFYRVLQAPTGSTGDVSRQPLPAVPQLVRDARRARLSRQERSERHGWQRPALARQLPDRSSQSDHRAMGRLVRDGQAGPSRHLGNAPVADRNIDDVRIEDANLNLADLRSRFDTSGYLSPHSDVVALLVFNHQLRMMNLLTRIGWQARTLAHEGRSEAAIAHRTARHRDRDGGLHAVRGRGAALGRQRDVRLCGVVQHARTA